MQRPENFAEFADDINPILDDLAKLRVDNWVKGRRLSSEAVNVKLVPGEGYPPYKFGTMVEDIEIGVGEKIFCVEFEKQGSPGGWMGKKIFSTEEEARQGNVPNVLVTPFQYQTATFSIKIVIFSEILRLNKIQ